jgi:hypothetical protein
MKTTLAIAFVTLAIGLIAYDQYDNHRFAAEYQHICDTQGC